MVVARGVHIPSRCVLTPRHSLTCRYRVRKMKRLEFDFLNTESEYRSYLIAASRLNFAVGREVIP